jgi:hypothetical protein
MTFSLETCSKRFENKNNEVRALISNLLKKFENEEKNNEIKVNIHKHPYPYFFN